jgi:hypothetical protein
MPAVRRKAPAAEDWPEITVKAFSTSASYEGIAIRFGDRSSDSEKSIGRGLPSEAHTLIVEGPPSRLRRYGGHPSSEFMERRMVAQFFSPVLDQICPRWNPLTSWMRQIEDFQRAA